MKRYLFLAASAAFVLASCTSEVDFSQESLQAKNESSTAVQFGTYMGKTGTMRATTGETGILTTTTLQNSSNGFGVYGYLSASAFADNTAVSVAPNFMWNEQVTYSSSAWSYSPVKYWPNGEDGNNSASTPSNTAVQTSAQYLNFFAYAPWVSAGVAANDGITSIPDNDAVNLKIGYKLSDTPTDATKVVDLLWGMRGNSSGYALADGTESDAQKAYKYNVGLTKQKTAETVDFLFKHALAKIGGYDNTNSKSGLKVVYDIDGNSSGVSGNGTTDANTLVTIQSITIQNGVDGSSNSTLFATGNFDISTGTWSDCATSGSTTPSFGTTIATSAMNTAIAEPATPSYSAGVWSPVGVTTTAQDVYKSGADVAPLFFIPGVTGQTIKVSVTYIVRTYDAGLATSASGGEGTWTKVTQTITNEVTLPNTTEPNKFYTLVIHLGLTSVKFFATVDDWDDGTSGGGDGNNQEIWLPSNVVGS